VTKVQEYIETLKKMMSLIPAYSNTPWGDEFASCNAKIVELMESMTDEEKQQLDDVLGRFRTMDDGTVPLVD